MGVSHYFWRKKEILDDSSNQQKQKKNLPGEIAKLSIKQVQAV